MILLLNMEFSSSSWIYSWAGGMGKCALQGQTASIWARRIRVWEGAWAMASVCSFARARNTCACPIIWKWMAHNFAQHAHALKSPKNSNNRTTRAPNNRHAPPPLWHTEKRRQNSKIAVTESESASQQNAPKIGISNPESKTPEKIIYVQKYTCMNTNQTRLNKPAKQNSNRQHQNNKNAVKPGIIKQQDTTEI